MWYARFHADYTDVGRYFDRVALALGRQNAPPGCNPGCSLLIRITRAARAARQRAAGQQIGKQARQESNLQPPVLESRDPRVHGGTVCTMGSGSKRLRGSLCVA